MKSDGDGGRRQGGAGAEDLLVAARRNEIGASEWQELERAMAVDPTLRVAHQVGRDFDRIATVRAGDEALIARVADRVLAARAPSARRRGGRRLAVAVGLGVALFGSAAAAWWAVRSAPRSSAGPSQAPRAPLASAAAGADRSRRVPLVAAPPPAPAPTVGPALAPRSTPALAPAPGAGLAPASPAPAGGSRLPSVSAAVAGAVAAPARPNLRRAPDSRLATAAAPTAIPTTAAELFRRANSARRAGDVIAARSLYGQVEARFPASDEARLSHVSLGKLLLGAGDARAAEAKFALYVAGGGGPLLEEALVGRAQSLERLARRDDERRVWQRLVDEFPSSVYASQARRRLAELAVPAAATAPP